MNLSVRTRRFGAERDIYVPEQVVIGGEEKQDNGAWLALATHLPLVIAGFVAYQFMKKK